ncbi:MAG: hypothetical protein ACLQPD_26415, partial [Desulfomonilaceae bacterium]
NKSGHRKKTGKDDQEKNRSPGSAYKSEKDQNSRKKDFLEKGILIFTSSSWALDFLILYSARIIVLE